MLVSGKGGNLAALLSAGIKIDLVVSDRDAPALGIARRAKVASALLDRRVFVQGARLDEALLLLLCAHRIDFVLLAGFMSVLGSGIVQRYKGNMVNIHPSLLPKFKGLNTHARVLAAGAKTHGCTVHWVAEEVDSGPVIKQQEVPVQDGDDEKSLEKKITKAEHELYPQVVKDILAGKTVAPW